MIRAHYELAAEEPERAAEALAGEMSSGTFTALPGETPALRARHRAVVEDVEIVAEGHARATLLVPEDNVGADLAALVTALAGNVFEMRVVDALALVDFELPPALEAAFPGPAFGVHGTRDQAAVQGRPLLGTIVKPSVGLSPEATAAVAERLARAGLDFIKDDELIADPPYSPVRRRIALVCAALEGRTTIYAPNVTSGSIDAMAAAAERAAVAGARAVMVCVHAVGLAAVLALRERIAVPIHGHRVGWGLLGRGTEAALGPAAHARLWRLAGVDQLHVGGLRSKFFESDAAVRAGMRACLADGVHAPVMPVLSSGQWGGQLPDTVAAADGPDFLYLAGGAIFGHRMGMAAGVRALRAGARAAMDGRPLAEAAADVPELACTLAQFGAQAAPRIRSK